MFEDLKRDCLEASDFDLHYAALVVFNELTTRRLGGKMSFDASGNALVVVSSPVVRKSRAKTPKKIESKQEVVDEMFGGGKKAVQIGEEIELEGVIVMAAALAATAPPFDSQEEVESSYHSVSPEPSSDPRPIPPSATPAKKGGKAKSRE